MPRPAHAEAPPRMGGGSGSRARGGSASRPRGGSATRPRGGSATRPRGGSGSHPRGGSASHPRGGSAPHPRGGSAPHPRGHCAAGGRARGVALLGVLVLVAALGAAIAMVSQVWSAQLQRAREAELLAIGTEMRAAIASYARATPRGQANLPLKLEDLVLDRRFPMPVRHLRRIYRDPFSGEPTWGVLKLGNGINGVYSLSQAVPLRKARFPVWAAGFENAKAISDWQFIADLRTPGAPPPAPAASSPSSGGTPPPKTVPAR